jgi:ABC-type sugar transport system substrate-binding protein
MDGDVVTGGFDLVTNVLDQIQNGTAHFTIGQDPYSQGFMSTMMMYSYLDRGIPGKDYITGAEVITEENVAFAKSRSGSWGALREWQRGNYNN